MADTPPAAPAAEASARERLVTAALELFNSRGYAATSVREICAAAGVTKPVLYYHFESKEGLYLHVMKAGFSDLEPVLKAARERTGPVRERLALLLDETYELFLRHVPEVRLMHAIYYGPPQGAPPFDFEAYHKLVEDRVRELIEAGAAAGECAADRVEEATWLVLGILNTAIEIHLCHPEVPFGRETILRMLDVVWRGMCAPADAGRASSAPTDRLSKTTPASEGTAR